MSQGPSQTTNQSSVSQPWAPSQPLLNQILGTLGGTSFSPTSAQTGAGQNLITAAGGIPNFSPQAGADVNKLLGGGDAYSQAPLLAGAYSSLSNTLTPFTNPANLNPMSTPGLAPALSTLNEDITNQISSQWAGAGRDITGNAGGTKALARGLAQGEAPLLLGQYNTNVGNLFGAENSLFGGAGTTASGLTGLNQLGLTNMLSGMGAANQIPGLTTGPAAAQLAAANASAQLPFQNLGWASSIVDPIAALGTQGQGTSTTTTSTNPWMTLLGAGLGGAGLLGGMGAFGKGGWLNFGS